ncbi:MAG: DUF4397 domain-containing protein [bacterium]
MKKLLLKLFALGALLGLGACGGATTNLQVFNASPDAPPVDVFVGKENAAGPLAFADFQQYQEVSAGNQTLRVNEAATSRTLTEQSGTLAANQDYTLIVVNFLNQIQTLLLSDDNSVDQPSNAKLRLVNAAPSAPGLDFYFTAPNADLNSVTPLLSDLGFKEVSDYLTVGAATYRVRVTQTGTKTVLVDSGNFVLSPSQVRTGVVIDSAGGGAPFNIVFLPDKL